MRIQVLLASAIAASALLVFSAPASAQTATATAIMCKDGTTAAKAGEGACVDHGGLAAKTTSTVQHSVTCKDGTTHTSRAACKDHGGVQTTEHSTTTTTVKKNPGHADDTVADATALCKNGKYWHSPSRDGACAANGGVDRFLKP